MLIDFASNADGSQKLTFSTENVTITTFLYEINGNDPPNWFGVAVPDGVADFTKPIVYFHPTPNQGPYQDIDYPTKTGTDGYRDWKELFEYIDRLGHQVAGAIKRGAPTRDQIVILPFMTTGIMGSAGILPVHWNAILTDILIDVRAAMTGIDAPLAISEVIVASFSNGANYSQQFRTAANGLSAVLTAVWDFDCVPPVTSTKPVRRYDKSAAQASTHLPRPRWDNMLQPPPAEEPGLPLPLKPNGTPNGSYVHHLIRDFMFFDAVMRR